MINKSYMTHLMASHCANLLIYLNISNFLCYVSVAHLNLQVVLIVKLVIANYKGNTI